MPNPAEPLRKKANPSVADLIATRMMQAVRETEEKDGRHDWNVRASRALAEALMDWDRKPHPAEMRALTAELQKGFAVKIQEYEHLPAIVGLYDRRIDLGDGAALVEYCDWVKTVRAASVLDRAPLLFRPMILHPADPAVARAAERAFEDADSTWVKFLNERPRSRAQMSLFGSSLVVVPAFRKRVVRELGDKGVVAAAIVEKDGILNYFSGTTRARALTSRTRAPRRRARR